MLPAPRFANSVAKREGAWSLLLSLLSGFQRYFNVCFIMAFGPQLSYWHCIEG